eukprot:6821466-Pyramimonas_sp.AAC.1
MDQCTTGSRDSHGVLIRTPAEITASGRRLLTPFERRRCAGHHQHASICNKELRMAAHYTSHVQDLFVDAVHFARDLFQVNRGPFHGHSYFSTVLAANARGYDLDDPTIPRQPDGSTTRPPSGGPGCLARADH